MLRHYGNIVFEFGIVICWFVYHLRNTIMNFIVDAVAI